MKQEILVWKHFDQGAIADLARAQSTRARRDIIDGVLGLGKKEWHNKGNF